MATATKKAAPKKASAKKEETRLVLTVMEITHGSFLTKHYHYQPNLIDVAKSIPVSDIRKGAEEAAKIASGLFDGCKVKVIVCEEVEARTREDMRASVEKFKSLIKE